MKTAPDLPDRVRCLEASINDALSCTPFVRDGEIIYDCGDPWAILRNALGEKP